MTMLDEDTEVHIDEQTADAPPTCQLPNCEAEASWVPICPNGHIVLMRSTNSPAYVCDPHGKEYPHFLLTLAARNRFMACNDCGKPLDGTLLPLP